MGDKSPYEVVGLGDTNKDEGSFWNWEEKRGEMDVHARSPSGNF